MSTIIELNDGRRFELRRRKSMAGGVFTCDVCDAHEPWGCSVYMCGFNCAELDDLINDGEALYLVALATPSFSSDTPSEARREAADL